MKCPVCDNTSMREVQKGSVQVDICPDCKGVWLDRGELDKLMGGVREMREEYDQYEDREYRSKDSEYSSRDKDYRDRDSSPHYKKKKKKEGILDMFGDLFG